MYQLGNNPLQIAYIVVFFYGKRYVYPLWKPNEGPQYKDHKVLSDPLIEKMSHVLFFN